MTTLALLRHAATPWNQAGRIQGSRDIPLSEAGRRQVLAWRLPPDMRGWRALSSPQLRARETAALLGLVPELVPSLAEMRWGAWEGQRLEALRHELGERMVEMEARGLDMRPPGGETPRELQARLRPLLAGIAASGRPTLAITHRGVLRVLMALACGWDMLGRPPVKLASDALQLFRLDAEGGPHLQRANLPLLS